MNLRKEDFEGETKEKSDLYDFKKKRDEYNLEIRKQKREDILTKRRNKNLEIDQKLQDGTITSSHNLANDPQLKELVSQWLRKTYNLSDLYQLAEAINSKDRAKQHYGVIGLRKIISEHDPPIQPIIDANLVPRLIQFMQNGDEPHLQLEAAWALTNIASGTTQQTQSIIDKGGIQCFINLLRSDRKEVAEQAIWAIGNIGGDSFHFRDLILKLGGIEPLIQIVNTTEDKSIIKHGTWAISNLCRGRPLPDLERIIVALPTIAQVLKKETDVEVLTDAAWTMTYLSRQDVTIQDVVETEVVPSLIHYLDTSHLSLLIPCLRTIGNIVTSNEAHTAVVLREQNFLPKFYKLLGHKKKTIRKEACWVLSNITAGNQLQVEAVMGDSDFAKALIEIAEKDIPEVQREAAWALSNATKNCTIEQLVNMVENGLMRCFIGLLDAKEPRTLEIVLEGLWNILNWGALLAKDQKLDDNPFLVQLENAEAVPKIEDLQVHPNTEVYLKALRILENHFELDSFL